MGKAVGVEPTRANKEIVSMPNNFYKLYCFVTLVVDVMFLNFAPFLVTLLRKIQLRTVEHVPI